MTPAFRCLRPARPFRAMLALALVLPAVARTSPARAQTPGPAEGPVPGIEAVAFLAGCWAGTPGSVDMREQWTEAEGGVMLGTTRFYRDGVLVDFEFGMISTVDGVLTLWPYPRGSRSEHGFPLVRTEPDLVFENLEHDFPVRIIYAREGERGLAPRIEGSDGSGTGWRLARVACPG